MAAGGEREIDRLVFRERGGEKSCCEVRGKRGAATGGDK